MAVENVGSLATFFEQVVLAFKVAVQNFKLLI